MSELLFLTISEVLEIHDEQVDLYGGDTGVRDSALLESALAAPLSGMDGEYFHADIFDMAAAYLYHIVQNHPFVDGNKRTGLACAYLFLAINGYELECDPDELADMRPPVENRFPSPTHAAGGNRRAAMASVGVGRPGATIRADGIDPGGRAGMG